MRPPTLIQIHYHNRPGGVTTVMAAYAAAFRVAAGPGAHVVTVCRDYGRAAGGKDLGKSVSVSGCDYHVFRSIRAFNQWRRRLAQTLERVLERESQGGQTWVIAHNLALGRNPALSAAFADIVRRRSSRRVRFFAVVHDRPEEGRPTLLAQLRVLTRKGVPVRRFLYPRTPRLIYVTPGPWTRQTLAHAGYRVRELSDPVPAPAGHAAGLRARQRLRAALARTARCDGVNVALHQPLAFYPSRVIGRKNVLEAVIVACLVLRHALIAGAPGTTPPDRRLCAQVRAACRRFGLPVLIDAGRAVRPQGGFSELYHVADLCISTSVLEGFGYALYEPWAYGKAVVGRRPAGFVSVCGVDHSHLYDRMLVPKGWVGETPHNVPCSMDFAALSVGMQVRVLERLIRDPGALAAVRFVRGEEVFDVRRLVREVRSSRLRRITHRNRRLVLECLGFESFCRAFVRCFFDRLPADFPNRAKRAPGGVLATASNRGKSGACREREVGNIFRLTKGVRHEILRRV